MATAFLAVASAATCAPLNPAYQAAEFDFYLADLEAKALLTLAGLDTPARSVAQVRGIPVIDLWPCAEAAGLFTLTGEAIGPPVPTERGYGRTDDIALTLHTSGTTTQPKLVPLSHANLCHSAAYIQATLQLTPADCCLNMMPLFHLHGLMFSVLATLHAGGSVFCAPGFDAAIFFAWLDECRPTWYTAVPAMHQAIVARAEAHQATLACQRLRVIRSFSAPLPDSLIAALEETFHAPVIEAYGMTEAAPITSNPLPPAARKAGSVGPAAGPEVAIMAENGGVLLPAGAVGEIVVRGPNVVTGYARNPAGNQAAFHNGWFRTGDQGWLDGDSYLYLTGRFKEFINRGGEKIAPYEVEAVLGRHPAVAQAVAFALPHPHLGEEVATAVVLAAGQPAVTEKELIGFVAGHLTPYKVPRRVVFVGEIPKGPTGKLQRLGLAEKLGLSAQPVPAESAGGCYQAPADSMEQALVALWEEVLGIRPVGLADNFFDLGGHSLPVVRLFKRIEQCFGCKLPPATLFQAPTIKQLAAVLREAGHSPPWSPLVLIRPGEEQPPFFCVHGLGGHILRFYYLAHALPAGRPFYGLQSLGLDGRHAPQRTIEAMATHYLQEIQSVQPQGPYLLGGFSAGGFIALEMARRLTQQGQPVGLVALFDTSANHAPGYRRSVSWRTAIRARLGSLGQKVFAGEEQRDDGETADEVILPDPEREPIIKQVVAANRAALAQYLPRPYPVKIALFKALERAGSRDYGWRELAPCGLEVYELPGRHTTILKEPHVQLLAGRLKAAIDRALA
jgi:acyl-CoA synthetase (AMP-forming)/AMP-acid ligase II/thioesterase domain-containing protein/acyl carrier protein